MELRYKPTLSGERARENLFRLMVPGVLGDDGLSQAITRLNRRFRDYVSVYNLGLWGPGLALTNEMRAVTDLYLPRGEISRAFGKLFSLAMRHHLHAGPNPLTTAASWLDVLQQLRQPPESLNPGRLLETLASDEACRIRFIFAFFLPRRHGESFARYPEQGRYLEQWLISRRKTDSVIHCLDAACGTGEGTYDLARLLLKSGIRAGNCLIEGRSIEPLEIYAAAHCCFPHDTDRERLVRAEIEPLFSSDVMERITFTCDDVTRLPSGEEAPYDIIVCNGLLGGPFFHGAELLEKAVAALSCRLKPGGILLVADRFHDGWKKKTPGWLLEKLLRRYGLNPFTIGDGKAAEKTGG